MNFTSTPQAPQNIVFDWDGTLAETGKGIFHTLNTVLTAFGREPLTKKVFTQQPHLSNRMFFRSLFPEHQVKEAEDLYNQHAMRLSVTAFPYSAALLAWIFDKNIPMALVSNKEGSLLRKEVGQMGWSHYFKSIVGSYDTTEDKPSPLPLFYALEMYGQDPGPHTWFVGDSLVDMECAKAAGCTPVAIGPGAQDLPHALVRALNGKALLDILHTCLRHGKGRT